jgi:hypothetical protein
MNSRHSHPLVFPLLALVGTSIALAATETAAAQGLNAGARLRDDRAPLERSFFEKKREESPITGPHAPMTLIPDPITAAAKMAPPRPREEEAPLGSALGGRRKN